jgi:hypothetical protein
MSKDKRQEQDEKTTKRAARNTLRNQMREALRTFLGSGPELEESILDAIKFFAGKSQRGGAARVPGYMVVIERINNDMKVSEDDIWNEYKMGRIEMRNAIRKYVKKSIPGEEIAWIKLNDENVYEVVEVSATVPEGWDGPLPTTTETITDEKEDAKDDESIDL